VFTFKLELELLVGFRVAWRLSFKGEETIMGGVIGEVVILGGGGGGIGIFARLCKDLGLGGEAVGTG